MKKEMGVMLAVAAMLHAKIFNGQVSLYEGSGLVVHKTGRAGSEGFDNFLSLKSGARNISDPKDLYPSGVLVYRMDHLGRKQAEMIITAGTKAIAPKRLELHLVLSGTGKLPKAYAYVYVPGEKCTKSVIAIYTSAQLSQEPQCVIPSPAIASSGELDIQELTVRGKEASIKGELKSAKFKDPEIGAVNFGFSIDGIKELTPKTTSSKPLNEIGVPPRETGDGDITQKDTDITQGLTVTRNALLQQSTLDSR